MFPESNSSPVSIVPLLSTGEAATWVLCSVLSSSLPERYRGPGAYPEKDSGDVKGLQHE